MASDFYTALEALINPRNDLGGGPGAAGSAQAIADLVMGGGSASVGGKPLFGHSFGTPVAPDAGSFQAVMDQANTLAGKMPPGVMPSAKPQDTAAIIRDLIGKPVNPQQIMQDIQQEQAGIRNPNYQPLDVNKAAAVAVDAATADRQARLKSSAPIVEKLLQTMGIFPSEAQTEYQRALGKAAGERAGGKGAGVNPELTRAAGTDKFDGLIADEVAKGNITWQQQSQLENIHDRRIKASTVGDADRRALTSVRGSVEALQRIEDAYKETPAFKTGKISDTLRSALALSTKGASAIELSSVFEKLTPEERKYVSLYNTFRLNLRRVSEDSRFSNYDAQQVLEAIGNPVVGRDLYTEQIKTAREELINRHENVIDDMSAQGKKTEGFKRLREKQASGGIPQAGAVVKGYRFKGGDPSKQENWEKAQ